LLRTRPNEQIADTVPLRVVKIKHEQALVAGDRELITRFEAKIQATLALVWGEAVPAVASN